MPDIIIEELKGFDPALIDKIKRLEIENLGSEAAINEWIIPVVIRYGKFLVLRSESNGIIGICQILKNWEVEGCAFIHSFYISKGYRSRGYGKKLLEGALNILKKSDIHTVELTVDPENKVAYRLYERYGFKKIVLLKDEYGPGKDRHLLRRKI